MPLWDRLLDFLCGLRALDDAGTRGMLLNNIPDNLANSIPRRPAKNADLNEIIQFARRWGRLSNKQWAVVVLFDNTRRFVTGTASEAVLDQMKEEFLQMVAAGHVRDSQPHLPDATYEDVLQSISSLQTGISLRGNLHETQRHVLDLTRFALEHDSIKAREKAIVYLKDALFADMGSAPLSDEIRRVRRIMMKAISSLAVKELRHYFADEELRDQDLWWMDFGDACLRGVSFERAFLLESVFSGADLRESNFSDSFIRNTHFQGAVLDDANFSGADWFNAIGLTIRQLEGLDHQTLLPCPGTPEDLHKVLGQRYYYPFQNWPARIQEELVSTWQIYTAPGGLRDAVAAWKSSSGKARPPLADCSAQ